MLALLFARLLPETDASGRPLGPASATLARATQLASVCKLWRQAAVLAMEAHGELRLEPKPDTEPCLLTTLVADLAHVCHLYLYSGFLAASPVPAFLERAQLAGLETSGPPPEGAAFSKALAACTPLKRLTYEDETALSVTWSSIQLPPSLCSLDAYICGIGGDYEAANVLGSVQHLPCLTQLNLSVSGSFTMTIAAPGLQLDQLKQLNVRLEFRADISGAEHWDLSALRLAAVQGVQVALTISVDSSVSADATAEQRQQRWGGLSKLSLLEQLQLVGELHFIWKTSAMSDAEEQMLAAVRCKHLILHDRPCWMPHAEVLLESKSYHSLISQYTCDRWLQQSFAGSGLPLQVSMWLSAAVHSP